MMYLVWALLLVLKLYLCHMTPLFADEMYYWVWAQNLSLSYFDHPPMVAWLIDFGKHLGLESIRLPGAIIGHFSLLVWLEILKPHLDKKSLWLFFLLLALNPLTGLGTALAVPDSPLMFFWSLSTFCFLRTLKDHSLIWYSLFGVATGLGFLSKYHIVLIFPIAILYLLLEKKWKNTRPLGVMLSVLLFVALSSPVLIWNYNNDWASFAFQIQRGLKQSFNPEWIIDYLGNQTLLIFPFVLISAITGGLVVRKNKELNWLNYFAWFVPLFFLYSSFKGRVEPNWTGVALPALFALAVLVAKSERWIKATLVLWSLFILALIVQMQFQIIPLNSKKLKTYEFSAYDEFLEYPKRYKPLYASSYQMAATLTYKTGIPVYKLNGTHRVDHYDYMTESMPDSDVFYVLMGTWNKHPDYTLDWQYEMVEDFYPRHDLRVLKFKKR